MILLSEILSSVGKVRILEEIWLSEALEVNITKLSTLTNMNHSRVSAHLEELSLLEIVEIRKFGRIKIIRFTSSRLSLRIRAMLSTYYETQKVPLDVNGVTLNGYSINKRS